MLFCLGRTYAQDANGVYSKVDQPPVPEKTPPPVYPSELKKDKVSGLVAVAIIIDEKGDVADAVVTKSTNPQFEKPSIDAVKSWHFKPARVAGNAVKVRVVLPLKFESDS